MDTLAYYNKEIRLLEIERNAITKTGSISPEQGLRLDAIDLELRLWFKYIDIILTVPQTPSQPSSLESSS